MREILFKAKRRDNGEWAEGQYAYILNSLTESGEPIKHLICNGTNIFNYEIDLETLCQYTGMKDKNGKRIWENDIVRIENSMDEGIGNIEFYGGMWYVDGEPSNSLYDIMEYDDIAEVEVIGNIFDDQELLKGE